jgi:hypothetical protein
MALAFMFYEMIMRAVMCLELSFIDGERKKVDDSSKSTKPHTPNGRLELPIRFGCTLYEMIMFILRRFFFGLFLFLFLFLVLFLFLFSIVLHPAQEDIRLQRLHLHWPVAAPVGQKGRGYLR